MVAQTAGSHGFRPLRVRAKVRESDTITSFHLSPVEEGGWRSFEPGQFLVFKIPGQPDGEAVLRNYSVSCAPGQAGHYRISVKREAGNPSGVPDGVASCYLHDRVQVGDVLMAEGPRGDFVLDSASNRPVVLLSGGVGLTPLVSMLHALAGQSERRVLFVHACDNGAVHALGDEVRALAASRSGITSHFVYRFPTAADSAAARHQDEGVMTRALLQKLLHLDDYDFYLCGPPPFMQAVYALVRSLGVAKERIAYEFFGPATVLEQDLAGQPKPTAPAVSAAATNDAGIQIHFKKSGRSAPWDSGARSLLEFAENVGLAPDFSCRAGVCGTCSTGLLDGQVSYFEEPLDAPQAHQVLLCCARPSGSLVLDL
jgi:ferredoxin-NADP reductase